jgi:hypothetical protein
VLGPSELRKLKKLVVENLKLKRLLPTDPIALDPPKNKKGPNGSFLLASAYIHVSVRLLNTCPGAMTAGNVPNAGLMSLSVE